MKISKDFKRAISNFFYDKQVLVYETINQIDEELNVIRIKGEQKELLKCNVIATSKDMILKEYGLNIDSNIILTCLTTKAIENDIAIYKNKEYEVKGVIEFDSHTKVFLNEISV